MLGQELAGGIDDQLIELIAGRVADMLQDNLAAIAAELAAPSARQPQLTVGQVAQRLGVTRSTVYAHWREWGGYKLGSGPKAPIRFDGATLPIDHPATPARRPDPPVSSTRPAGQRHRRPRRDLLKDAPRLTAPLNRSA